MMQRLALLSACVLGLAGMGLAGCTPSQQAASSSSETILDSLQTANERLATQVRLLSDSLQFYDDLQSGQYRRERRAMQDDLTRLAYEVSLLREGGQVIETLSTDVIFELGTTSFTDDASDRLRTAATRMRTTYRNRTVRVEAHTDNQPLSDSRYTSHWALTAGQAAAVVDTLVSLTRRDAGGFRAVALGAAQPVASNETRSGQARNRRIRIMVLPPDRPVAHPYETVW